MKDYSNNCNKSRVKWSVVGEFKDTRINNEDFALTPFLFGVWINGGIIKVIGIGICWGYYCGYLGLGMNIPNGFPRFRFQTYKKETTK